MATFTHRQWSIREFTPVNILRLLLLSLGSSLPCPSNAQYHTDQARWNFYLALTAQYSPTGHEILKGISSESDKWVAYAYGGVTANELILHSSTLMHQGVHIYEGHLAEGHSGKVGYFIAPGVTLFVSELAVFDSTELSRLFPNDFHKNIFRYGRYFDGAPNEFSQTDGILGALGELSSYYHPALFTLQTRPWLEKNIGFSNPEEWRSNYFNNIGNAIVAFHEFRLFMGWYLVHVQKYQPEHYRAMMNNINFRIAFTLLHNQFMTIAEGYENEVANVLSKLMDAGNGVLNEDPEFDYGGNDFRFNDISYQKSLMTPEFENELRALSMPEVTIDNFSSYLEDESE